MYYMRYSGGNSEHISSCASFWINNITPEHLGLLLKLKGSSGIEMGPGRKGEWGDQCLWAIFGNIARCLSRRTRYRTPQAEMYAILASTYKIHMVVRSEKYLSICSDSQTGLENPWGYKNNVPLVLQCQKALNDISTAILWECFAFPNILGYVEKKLSLGLQEKVFLPDFFFFGWWGDRNIEFPNILG